MEEISKRIWKDYMGIRGGDFSNWYEGLSPIEVKILEIKFNINQKDYV
jgi:hypothetical protein